MNIIYLTHFIKSVNELDNVRYHYCLITFSVIFFICKWSPSRRPPSRRVCKSKILPLEVNFPSNKDKSWSILLLLTLTTKYSRRQQSSGDSNLITPLPPSVRLLYCGVKYCGDTPAFISSYCSISYLTKLIPIFIQIETWWNWTNRLIEIDDQNKIEYKKSMIIHFIIPHSKLTNII